MFTIFKTPNERTARVGNDGNETERKWGMSEMTNTKRGEWDRDRNALFSPW